jgi:RND family efflux transporter MFP subunit
MRPIAFWPATMVVGLSVALAGCGEPAPPPPQQAAQASGASLVLAPQRIDDVRRVPAIIATRDMAEARARIPGTLVRLDVRAGDMVARGQRIGLIVDDRINLGTTALGADLAAAQAQAANAAADLGRVRSLHAQGVYAQARLDQAQAAADAAAAAVRAARARQAANAQLAGDGAVLAPAAGRVLAADVPAGSVVAPGTSIASIAAGAPMLRLMVPEALAPGIAVGTAVRIDDPALPGASGRVVQIYPSVAGGDVRVDAAVPGLADSLLGRRVAAGITVGTRSALVVPRRYVVTRFGLDQLMVRGRDGVPGAVPVQIAATADPALVEIIAGAAAGDKLVAPKP